MSIIPETIVERLGVCDTLNVGAGHLKLSFDKNNPEEVEKSKQAIQDMLKRGYTILVEVPDDRCKGGVAQRPVKDFDPETCEYILQPPERKKPGRKPGQRVAAADTKSTAIAPTAGG